MTRRKHEATADHAAVEEIDDEAQYNVVMAETVEHGAGNYLLRGHTVQMTGAVLKQHLEAVEKYAPI